MAILQDLGKFLLRRCYDAPQGLSGQDLRVPLIAGLLTQLRRDDVKIVKGPESHENGKFAWILDPDGNKLELWQPMVSDEKNA